MNALEFQNIFDNIGVSQSEFGKLIGKSRQTVSGYYEKGISDIDLINKVNKIYNDWKYKFVFADQPNQAAEDQQPYLTSNQLIDQMKEEIENLKDYIRLLKQEKTQLTHQLKECTESIRVIP